MTTLRRELRKKFEEILLRRYGDNPLKQDDFDTAGEVADSLADAALSVSGIANSQKRRDPMWDLLHGENPQDLALGKEIESIHNVALRLEHGLRRNQFPESPEAQKIYKWILEQEEKGEKLETWMEWATDNRRAEYTFQYHRNVAFIKRDWPQAFQSKPKFTDTKIERDEKGIIKSW